MSRSAKNSRREERLWRYLVPNLITIASMLFGLASIFQSMEGNYVTAGWLILCAVLTDKIDGIVARVLRGTSELGVQLDSLADFLNFGIAPPVMVYASLSSVPELHFNSGTGRFVLTAACTVWLVGAVYRLARFNVSTAVVPKSMCFGVPTTVAAGALAAWYLTLLKYTAVGHVMGVDSFGGPKILPFMPSPDGVWRYLPLFLFAGGALMGSNLRMANIGGMGSRWFTIFVGSVVLMGFLFIPLRLFPEFLVFPPTAWMIVFLSWGQISSNARMHKAPHVFPRVPVEEKTILDASDMIADALSNRKGDSGPEDSGRASQES